MFSSLVSYVSTSLSPKAWLAKSVAKALNDFFVLDNADDTIESNLLSDTKIVLRNARVRPRQLHHDNDDRVKQVWLSGMVQEMEFSWTWGGQQGKSSFIKDTRLTIRGAKFQIRIGCDSQRREEEVVSLNCPPTATNTTSLLVQLLLLVLPGGYIQREIQQIVDHLTLNIADLTLDIVDDDKPTDITETIATTTTTTNPHYGLCIQAKSLQLISIGRQKQQRDASSDDADDDDNNSSSPPLSQRVSLESIQIVLKSYCTSDNDDDDDIQPLLEPIAYAASIKRVSGRRFMDGWMTGLEHVGEVLKTGDNGREGVVIHAGTNQISTLSRFIKQLSSSNTTATTSSSTMTADASTSSEATKEPAVAAAETPAKQQQQHAPNGSPTTLSLPLPSITFILPRGTTIRMPGCTFNHSMDGSKSALSGNQGIDVGGQPFLALESNENDKENEWMIDFVEHKISLRPQQQQQQQQRDDTTSLPTKGSSSIIMARLEWKDFIVKQVVSECCQLLSVIPKDVITSAIQEYDAYANSTTWNDNNNENNNTTTTVWSFESQGTILIKVTCQEDWVQAKLQSPTVAISTGKQPPKLERLQVQGIEIGHTSFGQQKSSLLRISSMALETKSNDDKVVALKHGIDVNLESKEVLYQLQDFGTNLPNFNNFDGLSQHCEEVTSARANPTDSRNNSTNLSLKLQIPKIRLRLQKEGMQLVAGQTTIKLAMNGSSSVTIDMNTMQGWIIKQAAGASKVECLSLQGLHANFCGSSKPSTATIQQVDRLKIPDVVDQLEEPILKTSLSYDPSSQVVKMNCQCSLHLCLSPTVFLSNSEQNAPKQNPSLPSLAFFLEVDLSQLQLSISSLKTSICLKPLNFQIKPSQVDAVEVTTANLLQSISLRLEEKEEGQAPHWLQASMAPNSSISLSENFDLWDLNCAGAQLVGSSLGKVNVLIPSIRHSREYCDGTALHRLELKEVLSVTLQSRKVGEDIQGLLQKAMDCGTPHRIPKTSCATQGMSFSALIQLPSIQFCLEEESARVIFNKSNAKMTPNWALEFHAHAVQGSVSSASMALSDLKTTMHLKTPSNAQVAVGSVDAVVIPTVFELTTPLLDSSLTYQNGLLKLQTTKICGICPPMDRRSPPVPPTKDETLDQTWALPCSLHVCFQELCLRASQASSVLCLSSADLLVVPAEGVLSINLDGETGIHIESADKSGWTKSTLGPLSLIVDPTSSTTLPDKVTCSFLKLGPCSFGQLTVTVPSIEMGDGTTVQCGEVQGTVESPDMAKHIQVLLQDCFPSKKTTTTTTSFDLSLKIPKVMLSVATVKAKLVAENLAANTSTSQLACQRFGCQNESGMAAAFSGLQAQLAPSFRASIAGIDGCYLPEISSIENPIKRVTSFAMEGDTLCLKLPAVDMIMFGTGARKSAQLSTANAGIDLDLPFPLRLSWPQLRVKSFSHNGETTTLSQIDISAKPQEQDPFASAAQRGIIFRASINSVENKLLKLGKTTVSGCVYPSDPYTIHGFKLSTSQAVVTAGFSSVEWASVFGSQQQRKQSKPISLPMANVDAFLVNLVLKGTVVGMQETTVSIPAFQGGANTDSDALVQHIKQAVMGRFPAMLTNAQVLGENVSEMSAKTAGRVMLRASTATGAAAGSIVGLVASDSIRASISAGKQSRNAEAGDDYKFGDFSRGALHSISQAAKSGAQARRGSSEAYQLGDFTVGASKSLANYTGENKSRLGAAGGSGMGMMVGCAVAGPLGLVAGSILGSKLGGSAFDDSKSSAQQPQKAQEFEAKNAPPPTQTPDSSDLLGLSTTTPNKTQASGHQQAVQIGERGYPQQVPRHVIPSQGSNSQMRQYQQPSQMPTQTAHALGVPADLAGFGNCPSPSRQGISMQPTAPVASTSHPLAFEQPAQQKGMMFSQPSATQQPQHQSQHKYKQPNQNYSQQPSLSQPAQASPAYNQQQLQAYNQQPYRRRQCQQQQHHHQTHISNMRQPHGARGMQQQPQAAPQAQGYRFGDLTRSVIAKGKEKSGRSTTDSYKFGDFTRGLFK